MILNNSSQTARKGRFNFRLSKAALICRIRAIEREHGCTLDDQASRAIISAHTANTYFIAMGANGGYVAGEGLLLRSQSFLEPLRLRSIKTFCELCSAYTLCLLTRPVCLHALSAYTLCLLTRPVCLHALSKLGVV